MSAEGRADGLEADPLEGLRRELAAQAGALDKREAELESAKAAALGLVEEAEMRARQLLESARAEAERLRREESERGRAEGMEAGRAAAAAEQAGLFEQAREVLALAERERLARVRASESLIAELAVKVARRLLGREVAADAAYVARVAQELIGEVDKARRIEVRVCAGDFAAMLAERTSLERLLPQQTECAIVPDRSLAAGDVVIATEFGTVDGRMETRLGLLRQALTAVAKEWEESGDAADGAL